MSSSDSDSEGNEGAPPPPLPNVAFVDQPLDDNLRCAICLEVCLEATTACAAGHTFCGPCLRRMSARGNAACPTCRAVRINLPNRPLRDMVDNLRVRCREGGEGDGEGNRKRDDGGQAKSGGCDWEGPLGQWMEGHKKVCPYVPVECPLGCSTKMRRLHLEHHVKEVCHARQVSCDGCKMTLPHHLLPFHEERMCPKGMVQCHFCGEAMTREALGSDSLLPLPESFPGVEGAPLPFTGHYSECPKMILKCEFAGHGCEAKFAREDAAAHHSENAQYHAALVNQTLKRLDWDYVQFTWPVHGVEIAGIDVRVLESSYVSSLSPYKLFLKLHLRGHNDPIKISVCSASIKCVPLHPSVRIKNMHVKVVNYQAIPPSRVHATFDMEEEKQIAYTRNNSGVFNWSITPKNSNGREFTRYDLYNSVDDDGCCTIRVDFCIRKHNSVILRTARQT